MEFSLAWLSTKAASCSSAALCSSASPLLIRCGSRVYKVRSGMKQQKDEALLTSSMRKWALGTLERLLVPSRARMSQNNTSKPAA
jgi:hypothetical protein